jgi:RimJ/RimL family protein N-acetyltransferase
LLIVQYSHRSEHELGDGRDVVVRFKTPGDLKAWRRFIALVPDDSGHRPGTELDVADLSTDYHRFDEPYLVAEVAGEIVGALFIVPRDPVLGYHRDHAVEFHMDVLPGWRRLGVGTALVASLMEWAGTQEGVVKLEAAALGWNEPILAMLGKLGFREEGRAKRSWMVRTAEGAVEYDDIVTMGLGLE